MIKIKDEIAAYLLRNCPSRTDKVLMSRFGISYNTFRKIERGEPIRSSVAERLSDRLTREISQ